LHEAAIALLLVRPDLASAAANAFHDLDGAPLRRAQYAYAAAGALQRKWRLRLRIALGPQPALPTAPIAHLGLPDVEGEFGEPALREISRREEEEFGYDAWATYETAMDVLLSTLDIGNRRA
jgi:hypothetical protein